MEIENIIHFRIDCAFFLEFLATGNGKSLALTFAVKGYNNTYKGHYPYFQPKNEFELFFVEKWVYFFSKYSPSRFSFKS